MCSKAGAPSGIVRGMSGDDWRDARFLFLRFEGAIDPRAWRWGVLTLFALSWLVERVAAALAGPGTVWTRLVAYLAFLTLLFPFAALSAKRFQDRGRSGLLAFWVVAPSAAHALLTQTGWLAAAAPLGSALGGLTLACFAWFILELGCLSGRSGAHGAVDPG